MAAYEAFGEMERTGWSDTARAAGYIDLFAAASDQVVPHLLAAVNAAPGLSVLDLCCGQGNVSRALVAAGCAVTGADFSPAMLAAARASLPGTRFVEADAQDLPFPDAGFDAVVSNLGICHVPDQPRALDEVRRVLRPGGAFAMSVWCGGDRSAAFEILYAAVKAHGHPDVSAPAGPDFHQFADPARAEALLTAAGFAGCEVSYVDSWWDLSAPDRLYDIYAHGTVRAASLLARQPAENATAIRAAMAEVVERRCAYGDGWRVPVPAALVRAAARG